MHFPTSPEQGNDDYTSDFYPYNHRFLNTNLFLFGTEKAVTPMKDHRYHIEFFQSAGYTFTDTFNYLPRINEVMIGKFSSVNKESGDIVLTEGTACDEEGHAGVPRQGLVHIVYGEY